MVTRPFKPFWAHPSNRRVASLQITNCNSFHKPFTFLYTYTYIYISALLLFFSSEIAHLCQCLLHFCVAFCMPSIIFQPNLVFNVLGVYGLGLLCAYKYICIGVCFFYCKPLCWSHLSLRPSVHPIMLDFFITRSVAWSSFAFEKSLTICLWILH